MINNNNNDNKSIALLRTIVINLYYYHYCLTLGYKRCRYERDSNTARSHHKLLFEIHIPNNIRPLREIGQMSCAEILICNVSYEDWREKKRLQDSV